MPIWLLDQLKSEWKVIQQFPILFCLVSGFMTILIWLWFRHSYKERLVGKDELIAIYREKLGLSPGQGTPDKVESVKAQLAEFETKQNARIKDLVSFGSMETRTVLGDGSPGTMHEPSGIAVARASLLIADTNNHRILRGDPVTGTLEELVLEPSFSHGVIGPLSQ